MSGFYGYMYVGVWYRTTSTLLLWPYMPWNSKSSPQCKGKAWLESAGMAVLAVWMSWAGSGHCPVPQRGFSGMEEGAQGVSAAPQHLWDGVAQGIPFPCDSWCSWRSLLASWAWWYRLYSRRDREVSSPCSGHGHPRAAPAHRRSKRSSIPGKRMDLWGGIWTEARNFLASHHEKIPAPK